MSLAVVRDRRPGCPGRAACWPGPRPVYASAPWGQGQKRPERLPENRRAAPWEPAPVGLWLSRGEAGAPGPPPATEASEAHTGGPAGAQPDYAQPVQSARDRA